MRTQCLNAKVVFIYIIILNMSTASLCKFFQSFMPYELPTYNNMPHLSHTSLMSPLVNPFVSSNIFNLLQDEIKSDKSCTLRPFHIYDPSDPITALSVPTTEIARNNEQSPSTQVSTFLNHRTCAAHWAPSSSFEHLRTLSSSSPAPFLKL